MKYSFAVRSLALVLTAGFTPNMIHACIYTGYLHSDFQQWLLKRANVDSDRFAYYRRFPTD